MKKIISFSLWGDNPRYTLGAIQNAELAKIYYPNWICRFYINEFVEEKIINNLKNKKNVEIEFFYGQPNWTSSLYRFFPASDKEVSIFVSRDADSRISKREREAVKEWEESDKIAHIMRDHQYHARLIMAGMWGLKNPFIKNMKELILNWGDYNHYESDQKFLAQKIYPLIKNNSIVHDEFYEKKSFPINSGKRVPEFHVGQAYDGHGNVLGVEEYGQRSFFKYLKEEEGIELNDLF
jgi:hypothetical protein